MLGEMKAAEELGDPPPPPITRRPPILTPRKRRAPLPPSSPPPHKKTRDLPDLSLCHCCGLRFPSTSAPASGRSRKTHIRILRSLWRIVILCSPCLTRVRSGDLCSYCLAAACGPGPGPTLLRCVLCSRRVHPGCVAREHRHLAIRRLYQGSGDQGSFACVDCCPIPRLLVGHNAGGSRASLEQLATEASSIARKKAELATLARKNAMEKAAAAKLATERARGALGVVLEGKEGGVAQQQDPKESLAVPDEELALQLHLAMNGSQRILRSPGSQCSAGGSGGHKGGCGNSCGLMARDGGPGSHIICENFKICSENKYLFDAIDGSWLDSDFSLVSGATGRKKQNQKIDTHSKIMTSKWENGSCLQCCKQIVGMNDVVLALECVKDDRKTSELQEPSSIPDRYRHKYSKRNPTLKKVFDTNDIKVFP